MSLGSGVRRLLGDRGSRVAGRAYRALFVDLARASAAIAAEIPRNARVLDVGGGDGEPLNHLLALRPDIRVTTIDIAPTVGQWIDPVHAGRVERLPRTTLQDYVRSGREPPEVLLVSDVMHHVPVGERAAFLATAVAVLDRSAHTRIIVKDVEPGHWRARLGLLSDRYVTGDRATRLVSRRELIDAMRAADARLRWSETGLFAADPPNYALVFER